LPHAIAVPAREFIGKYIDIANIKVLLRCKSMGYDAEQYIVYRGRELAEWKLKELAKAPGVPELINELEPTEFKFLSAHIEAYKRTQSCHAFENALERYFLEYLRWFAVKHGLTLGVPIKFVLAKEYEIKNIRAIAHAVYKALPAEDARTVLVFQEEAGLR
jgi:V/A-type H+-transporting ATPase subunit C